MSTENDDDQRHADDAEQPPAAADGATGSDDTATADTATADDATDVWREATAPEAGGAEEPPAEPEPAADAESDSEPIPEAEPAAAGPEGAEEPRLTAVPNPDREPGGQRIGESPAEDAARQLISSVEGFLGSMFKDASETVERIAGKGREQARKPEPPADPAEFLESVESWVGDFFRGAPGKAARGFGRAAAGSALRSASSNNQDDVWANATADESDRDASRECRYCPFCQTLASVRNTRPELYDQIGDTAQRLVDLVKQAAEQSRGGRPWR